MVFQSKWLAGGSSVFLGVVLVASIAPSSPVCGQQGLIAYWAFEGDGEDENGDFPLDLNQPVSFDDGGVLGQAVDFDQSDGRQGDSGSAARPTDDDDFNFGDDDYTIQAWVNYDNVAGEQVLIEKFTDAGGPGWTLTKLANGEFHFFMGTGLNTPSGLIEPGFWNHVVARREDETVDLFINGVLEASTQVDGPVDPSDLPLLIGKRNDLDGRVFGVNGRVDEVAIWGEALSEEDIAAIYNNGAGSAAGDDFDDGLLGYWPLDGDGADASGLNRPLELSGNAVFSNNGIIGGGLRLAPPLPPGSRGFATRTEDDLEFNFGEFGDEDFSIAVWVNYNDASGEQVVIEKFDGSGGPGWTLTKLATNVYHFFSGGSAVNASVGVIETGVWHHLVVRRIDGLGDLFFDGQLVATSDLNPVSPALNPLLIGRRNAQDGRGFFTNGLIDDLSIWDRGLTEGEILFFYNDGAGNPAADIGQTPVRVGVPGNLAASNPADTQVTLTWTAPTPVDGVMVQGYNVYRTSPSPRDRLNATLVTDTQFVVTNLQPATRYCFQVNAVGDNDLQGASSEPSCETATGSAPIEQGLLAFWPFDDFGTDCAENAFPLELATAAVGFPVGLAGSALEISLGVTFPEPAPAFRPIDDTEFDFGPGDFTIQLWLNYHSSGGEQVLIEKFVGGGGPGWTLTKLANDTLHFFGGSAVNSDFSIVVEPGLWHHFVVRRSGDLAELFMDGVLIGSGRMGDIPDSSGPLIIGQRNKQDGRGFVTDGLIDEVAIWSRALSIDDIEELYDDGAGTEPKSGCAVRIVPGQPQNVGAAPGENDVTVSWSAPAPVEGVTVVGYNVYRVSPGRSRLNTGPVTGTQFTGLGLLGEAEYCFVVRAIGDNTLESSDSAEVCTTTTGPRPDVSTGLVGYWSFDEDGSDCGNIRHLSLAADEFSVGIEDGLVGGALSIQSGLVLDGVELAPAFRTVDDPEFDFGSNDFTIQLWVNFNTVSGEQVLIEKFIGGGGPGWTLTKLSSQVLLFFTGTAVTTPALTFIEPGVWYHVLARRRADTIELFFDGDLMATGAAPGSITPGPEPLIIGQRNKEDGRGFVVDGLIDEVAIWNRGLDDSEVTSLYNAGLGVGVKEGCNAPTRPNKPVDISAVAGGSDVRLSWSAGAAVPGTTVVGYDVFRTEPGRAKLTPDPITNTELTVEGLVGETEYCFAVVSVSDTGFNSEDSDEICATPTDPLPPVEAGLLGFWPFDDEGDDCTANGRDLDLALGVETEDGLVGDGLSILPGFLPFEDLAPAYRPVSDSEFDFELNDFTVQVWVNYESTLGEQVLIEKFTGAGGPGWTLTKLANNEFLFFLGVGINSPSFPDLEVGVWHQLVARRQESTVDLFFNNELVGSTQFADAVPVSDDPLIIGMRNRGDDRGFVTNGFIDEVGIWGRALSDAEITLLYSGVSGALSFCGDCTPVAEVCDDGFDNDCDGLADGADTEDCANGQLGPFVRGDCDGNGNFGGTPTEAIVGLNYSFRGGPPPPCLAACDAEANGTLGITDYLRILRAAFLGQGVPDPPFPDCALSALASDLELGCETPVCPN